MANIAVFIQMRIALDFLRPATVVNQTFCDQYQYPERVRLRVGKSPTAASPFANKKIALPINARLP
jgi:hypothetical protein